MPGYVTTHVLDTARGCPASGMAIHLFKVNGDERLELARQVTNQDGRTDAPILPQSDFQVGTYELVFFAGDYLRAQGAPKQGPLFLDLIPIRFGLSEALHYHVPLLLSPFGYSTYRGS